MLITEKPLAKSPMLSDEEGMERMSRATTLEEARAILNQMPEDYPEDFDIDRQFQENSRGATGVSRDKK